MPKPKSNEPEEELDDDERCPETGKKHVPDWSTVVVHEDGETYIDVSCENCGRSGCVGSSKTLAADINW